MAFDQHANLVATLVLTPPSPANSGTAIGVTTGTSTIFPAPPFNCLVYANNVFPTASNSEIVRVTAVNTSTDILTVSRQQENSIARTILVNDVIAMTVTAKNLTDIETTVNGGISSGNYGGGTPGITPIASPAITIDTSTGRIWWWYNSQWN